MKNTLAALLLLASGIINAATLDIGTYEGRDANSNKFKLHIQSMSDREGSYYGLLESEKFARLYKVEEFASGKFGLTTFRTLRNYVLGFLDRQPLYSLTASDSAIVIAPNQSTTDIAFSGTITFKKKSLSRLEITPLKAGTYRPDGSFDMKGIKSSILSPIDSNGDAMFASKASNLSGDYVLKEARENFYLVLNSELTDIGVKTKSLASNFAYFVNGSFLCPDKMVVVDDKTGEKIVTLNKK
ncbi:MAG: hypothetical protein AB7I27_05025 [Bacteriovoracaceae bacterium]